MFLALKDGKSPLSWGFHLNHGDGVKQKWRKEGRGLSYIRSELEPLRWDEYTVLSEMVWVSQK